MSRKRLRSEVTYEDYQKILAGAHEPKIMPLHLRGLPTPLVLDRAETKVTKSK